MTKHFIRKLRVDKTCISQLVTTAVHKNLIKDKKTWHHQHCEGLRNSINPQHTGHQHPVREGETQHEIHIGPRISDVI